MASPSYLVQLQSLDVLGSSATPAHPWLCGAHVHRALKKSAHILGMQLVKHYRFARAQYDDLRARGKRAAAAFRRIVRSFSRVLHALIRDGKAFDEDVYIAALKRRGVAWAQAL